MKCLNSFKVQPAPFAEKSTATITSKVGHTFGSIPLPRQKRSRDLTKHNSVLTDDNDDMGKFGVR